MGKYLVRNISMSGSASGLGSSRLGVEGGSVEVYGVRPFRIRKLYKNKHSFPDVIMHREALCKGKWTNKMKERMSLGPAAWAQASTLSFLARRPQQIGQGLRKVAFHWWKPTLPARLSSLLCFPWCEMWTTGDTRTYLGGTWPGSNITSKHNVRKSFSSQFHCQPFQSHHKERLRWCWQVSTLYLSLISPSNKDKEASGSELWCDSCSQSEFKDIIFFFNPPPQKFPIYSSDSFL